MSKDEHGQAAYVEHWATIPGSREGPFLALRKSVGSGQDGLLVVAGSVFERSAYTAPIMYLR